MEAGRWGLVPRFPASSVGLGFPATAQLHRLAPAIPCHQGVFAAQPTLSFACGCGLCAPLTCLVGARLGLPAGFARRTASLLAFLEHARTPCAATSEFSFGGPMGNDWVKSIGKRVRDDVGDCPTLPTELLDLLASLRGRKGERASVNSDVSWSSPPWHGVPR